MDEDREVIVFLEVLFKCVWRTLVQKQIVVSPSFVIEGIIEWQEHVTENPMNKQ